MHYLVSLVSILLFVAFTLRLVAERTSFLQKKQHLFLVKHVMTVLIHLSRLCQLVTCRGHGSVFPPTKIMPVKYDANLSRCKFSGRPSLSQRGCACAWDY